MASVELQPPTENKAVILDGITQEEIIYDDQLGQPRLEIVPDEEEEVLEISPTLTIRNSERIAARISSYDPGAPEAAHLRPHQVKAVRGFREEMTRMLNSDAPIQGMAILHPTGAGKTVTTAEIIRMLCGSTDSDDQSLKALVLIPGHQIKEQTLGTDEEVGAIQRFAPSVSVGEYSGHKKTTDSTVTVMTYQALPGAVARGDIEKIDPSIVICDEAHHVIDGTWANSVEAITRDRVRLGLTATANYSASRNVAALFPDTLDSKSMKEGIEEGILSPMRGFVYKGKARISVIKHGVDYDEESMFRAIANSEDNYVAAKICAQEVAQGRRGIVSCVPGFDRAHAKIMAEILSRTKVETPEGERMIRAAFVGGEIHPRALRKILKDHKEGKIDVLTYVNLLLEGWDSPESDFTILLRPTKSRVLAEQRLGRIIRPRQGKTASVHEFLYTIEGEASPQATHMDVFGSTVVKQGYKYGGKSESNRKANRKWKQGPAHLFSTDEYHVDAELLDKLSELDAVPLKDIRVLCGQEAIPFDWPTLHMLSSMFNLKTEEVEEILSSKNVGFRTEEYDGVSRTYFQPMAIQVIAEHQNIPPLPEDYVTLAELVDYHRSFENYRRVKRRTIAHSLRDADIAQGIYVTSDGAIVKAYPPEAKDISPIVFSDEEIAEDSALPTKGKTAPKKLSPDFTDVSTSLGWLADTLINPASAPTRFVQQRIVTAQSCLLAALKQIDRVRLQDKVRIKNDLASLDLVPSIPIERAMRAANVDIIGLVAAAEIARSSLSKLETYRSKK